MSSTSISLTNLDFDTIRNSLKTYLENQDTFADYNFEASNISVLLDILAYNTYQNSFYLNMVASEAFLDSAQLRDSIVSHAKDLNYLPKSFSSAYAEVDITIRSADNNKTSIVIPKGTQFSTRVGNENFIFTTDQNIVVSGRNTFTITDVPIYEGIYVNETFSDNQKIVISNETVDTNSITVTVIEDNGAEALQYTLARSLFGLDDTSQVFFLQATRNNKYEITFGDGVVGRKPKNNSIVAVQYRTCNGELPNGATVFKPVSAISGETDITVTTKIVANYGSVSEEVSSIKFNAPRHYTTQERAVNSQDFEYLLKQEFSEINAVTAFGGELLTPPKHGRVFIAVDLKDIDFLPEAKRKQFEDFIRSRGIVSIEPVFIEPEYTYIKINSKVRYNINRTTLNENDIKVLVSEAILNYNESNLDDFNRTLRYSRLSTAIDNADTSIVSNETTIQAIKLLSYEDLANKTAVIDFYFPVKQISSGLFQYKGRQCTIKNIDSGLFIFAGDQQVEAIGTIDLQAGKLSVNSFLFDTPFNEIEIYAVPVELDINTKRNSILSIRSSDISITTERLSI